MNKLHFGKFIMVPKINIKAVGIIFIVFIFIVLPIACDQVIPQIKFTLAIPENEYTYMRAAEHLKNILGQNGYKIKILQTRNALEAAQLVADNKADLCLLMNKSIFIADSLGTNAAQLRTVLPLFRRSMFFYVKKDSVAAAISPGISFRNRTIGVEIKNGETEFGLQGMLDRIQVEKNYLFTTDTNCNVIHFWDENYSPKQLQLMSSGWQSISISENWIKQIEINNPALKAITIPAIPDKQGSRDVNTLYTETLLLASTNLGVNAVYKLTKDIYQNKAPLINTDKMYATMNENFDRTNLLFSLHDGADAYLRRDNPTFLERYKDNIAFFASLILFTYAMWQTVRSRILLAKKNRVDKYFIEFLSIKEKFETDKKTQTSLYDNLFKNVLTALTEEKMAIADFHILSRLIQQEQLYIRLGK